jgi:hypothetical protein
MDKPWLPALRANQILFFPTHVCPQCGAKPVTFSGGSLYEPFRNISGTAMEYDPYFGYVRFDCHCHLNLSSETDPYLGGSLRVARVGDAMLPVRFVSMYSTKLSIWGMHAAEVNDARVRQAVQFLVANADPQALTGCDNLKALVYAIFAGQSPESAYETLKAMILDVVPVWQLTCLPTEVEVT